MRMMAAIIGMALTASADPPPLPSPPPSPFSGKFLFVTTIEPAARWDIPFPGASGTSLLFFGGPFLMHVHLPSSEESLFYGADGGVELRSSLREDGNGFVSLYAGCGLTGSRDEDWSSGLSVGAKLGVVALRSEHYSLEPYVGPGATFYFSGKDDVSGGIYASLRIDFH